MKKSLIIIIGALIVLIALALWLFFLLFSTPSEDGGVFADFNFFGGDQDTTTIETMGPTPEEEPVVNVNASRLRQLTFRPVIGFSEVFSTTTEPFYVLYAESGTGHIYRINLETGEEVRVSNTTIPRASMAAFSTDGTSVAMRSGFSTQGEVIVGTITTGSIDNQPLANQILDFNFNEQGELVFTEYTNDGVAARILNLDTNNTRTAFTVPFRSATVIWDEFGTNEYNLYNKPASQLMGYFYSINNSSITREPVSGFGLSAIANTNYISYNTRSNTEYFGYTYNRITSETSPSTIIATPEKCAFASATSSIMYCGYEMTQYLYTYPDDWYKGTRSFNDRIWEIDVQSGSALQIINPAQSAGRGIDITNMTASRDTPMLYFINKHDQTLWSYRR